MCSISVNETANKKLRDLKHSGVKHLEKKLFNLAKEADESNSGILDHPSCHFKRMPSELREARKKEIGRHRVYYTGFHKQCSYSVFFIKEFKKDGVEEEDDKIFQKKLVKALSAGTLRQLKED
ncbi:MAG: hypothetical protein KKH04_03855 [Proteobacteria bacterium]|nr:hypothetical protein [Pseudomonadota bacterium]